MEPASVQQTPNEEQAGDSTEERLAAFEREYAESLALSDALTEEFQKVKDAADKELEAVQSKITELVGIDRDEDDLDDASLDKYERLVEHERRLLIVSKSHGELIDRLELLHDGAPAGEDDEDGNERTGRQDTDQSGGDSTHSSVGNGDQDAGRGDVVPARGVEDDAEQGGGGTDEGGAVESERSNEASS